MRITVSRKRKLVLLQACTKECSKMIYTKSQTVGNLHSNCDTMADEQISEELLCGIVYATSAYSVWEDLTERFDKVNRMCIYQLHKEIITLSQGIDSIAQYFTKLKTHWSEYDTTPGYACPQSKDYIEHFDSNEANSVWVV